MGDCAGPRAMAREASRRAWREARGDVKGANSYRIMIVASIQIYVLGVVQNSSQTEFEGIEI